MKPTNKEWKEIYSKLTEDFEEYHKSIRELDNTPKIPDNETYYLVEYECPYDGRQSEGVFTEKGWKKWVKEENKDKDTSEESLYDEEMDENEDFIFTEIEVYE